MNEVLDLKPYIEYDPVIGYRYTRNVQHVLPRPGGGDYEIVINSAGIRSTREYTTEKSRGVFRILVFGDSYAAGQFVSNDQRFSELLERRVPKLEVINFALEGTGTDQQLLLYEKIGRQYEHDLVLLVPFLQNIRRNMVEARAAYDPNTGDCVLRAKPRFDLVEGKLVLRNVPVPKDGVATGRESVNKILDKTDARPTLVHRLKTRLNMLPGAPLVKKLVYSAVPWEPFPEYRSANTPEWQLMEVIIHRFKENVGEKPLVVVPLFYDSYVRYRMARNYWDRFASLTVVPGLHAIDLLPHFKRLGREAVRAFQGPYDCHFSPYGHLVVALALQEELLQRGLLSAGGR